MGWQWEFPRRGPSLFSRQAALLAWLAYPGSLSLNPWDWKDGQKSGAVQERLKGLGPRWEGAHPLPTGSRMEKVIL